MTTSTHAQQLPPAVFLMGPTAGGKTDLAVELVRCLPMEIVSVDSALVYRGMDIGTAKPGPEVLAQAPHRLIDFLDPGEAYSAARFRDDTLREMEDIRAAGRVPLLVGGTMLYFRALEHGLSELPAADEELRVRLEREAAERGWEVMHARLAEVDPDAAARIHPNDPQRIQRALEVYELTGRSLTTLCAEAVPEPFPYRAIKLAVAPPDRAELHRRIAVRFRTMLEHGFISEVEALRARGDLNPDLPAMRAVGYRQVWNFLAGQCSYEEMVERGIVATRQLAKRQFTWLRADADVRWFDPQAPKTLDQVIEYIKEALD